MSQAELEDDLDETEDDVPFALKKRKLEDTELDMTPMIDMTFQLLIFFLVTFKSDPSGGVPLPGARFGEAIPSKNAITISLKKAADDQPAKIYKGRATDEKNLIDTPDLKDQEFALEEFISAEVSKFPDKKMVLIVAGKDVKYKDVKRVAQVAGQIAEIQQLYVAVLEVK